MTVSPDTISTTRVSVVIILDQQQQVLFVWDAEWGSFGPPMSRQKSSDDNPEPAHRAAIRAAAEALGVPVEIGAQQFPDPVWAISGRDYQGRRYEYTVYRAGAHADFIEQIDIRVPHLWLPIYEAVGRKYEPLSIPGVELIVGLVEKGMLPGRCQYTGTVVVARKGAQGQEYLLRHGEQRGYSFPTRGRDVDQPYQSAAEEACISELGLTPGQGISLRVGQTPVVTTREFSPSYQTMTFYCHGVFLGDLASSATFVSSQPLIWATEQQILDGVIQGGTPALPGTNTPDADISPTVATILQALDLIPLIVLSVDQQ